MTSIGTPTHATTARVLSVNVGGVRTVESNGRSVETGIWKTPVAGPVRAEGVNLAGDDQADRTVHGGPLKAVYAFPSEHYPAWRAAYPDAVGCVSDGWGAFGENLTTLGLLETDVTIGDRFRCGSVELAVTQPRLPCFKLAIRLGAGDAVKRMLETGQCGIYFTIVRAGTLQAGDELACVERVAGGLGVAELLQIYRDRPRDADRLRAAASSRGLPQEWAEWLRAEAENVTR